MNNVLDFSAAKARRDRIPTCRKEAMVRINELEHTIRYKKIHIESIMRAGQEMGGDHIAAAMDLIKDEKKELDELVKELRECLTVMKMKV